MENHGNYHRGVMGTVYVPCHPCHLGHERWLARKLHHECGGKGLQELTLDIGLLVLFHWVSFLLGIHDSMRLTPNLCLRSSLQVFFKPSNEHGILDSRGGVVMIMLVTPKAYTMIVGKYPKLFASKLLTTIFVLLWIDVRTYYKICSHFINEHGPRVQQNHRALGGCQKLMKMSHKTYNLSQSLFLGGCHKFMFYKIYYHVWSSKHDCEKLCKYRYHI